LRYRRDDAGYEGYSKSNGIIGGSTFSFHTFNLVVFLRKKSQNTLFKFWRLYKKFKIPPKKFWIRPFSFTLNFVFVVNSNGMQARSQGGGIGGFVPPFHPNILQFSRVFEKKTRKSPPPKFLNTKHSQSPLKNSLLRRWWYVND